jgi:DNA-binding transcriptional LysR family regulator
VPKNVKVIQAKEFVRGTPEGRVYLDQAEQLLKDIAGAGAGLEGFHVLVDTRRVTAGLSATELWRLASLLAQFRRSDGRRIAILCPAERFDHSVFFALCAENRGLNVRAFMGYEDAMEWLLG